MRSDAHVRRVRPPRLRERPRFPLGDKALGTTEMPAIGEALHGDRAHYHLRPGKHNLLLEDWQHYWDFADRVYSREAPAKPKSP